MKVERIINTIYASNTYILYDPRYDEVWLVDAGDTNLVIEWIEKYSKTLKGVFLTHTHFDHILYINIIQILEFLPLRKERKDYILKNGIFLSTITVHLYMQGIT